jgi:hypothetical protein
MISNIGFEMNQYFANLYHLLVRAIIMEFKTIDMSAFFCYFCYFRCVLYVSVGVFRVQYVLLVSGCVFFVYVVARICSLYLVCNDRPD